MGFEQPSERSLNPAAAGKPFGQQDPAPAVPGQPRDAGLGEFLARVDGEVERFREDLHRHVDAAGRRIAENLNLGQEAIYQILGEHAVVPPATW